MNNRIKAQKWFLPFRLAQYILLFSVVVIWLGYPNFMQLQFVLYSISTLCFSILLATEQKHNLKNVTSFIIFCQFFFELMIETSVIYSTGNINSPFSALFILTIISASLNYRLIGTLMTASAVSSAYTFIIWLGFGGVQSAPLSTKAFQTIFSTNDSVFYSIFLHILIFYLVAFISGYLAERLRSSSLELEDTSKALRRAKLETDDILKNLTSGLLSVDIEGNIIYFNRSAEKILGYREEDVKGMSCCSVFSERMPKLAEFLQDGYEKNIAYPRKETDVINIENEAIPLGVSTSVLMENDNQIRGVIAIFSNLTEAKQLEAKVRIADRLAAVGELSAAIAHEIRNPLAAISGSVEVLERELEVSGENERLMNLIVKESDRLTTILDEFLIYAKIDRPSYNKVELLHLISEVTDILFHHRSFNSNIKINIESDESIIYVEGDDGLIKQLLINLAVNACEAFDGMAGELTFRLAVYNSENTVELYVQDNGPGIPKKNVKNIYQPFFSTKKEGTGLGLSIVHRVCTALNLKINVTSQPDEGTIFMIEFNKYQPEHRLNQSESEPISV